MLSRAVIPLDTQAHVERENGIATRSVIRMGVDSSASVRSAAESVAIHSEELELCCVLSNGWWNPLFAIPETTYQQRDYRHQRGEAGHLS